MAMKIGSPRFMLGAWRSPAQLKRAATQYDGWLGSAGPATLAGGWRKVFNESMKTYRDVGGKRDGLDAFDRSRRSVQSSAFRGRRVLTSSARPRRSPNVSTSSMERSASTMSSCLRWDSDARYYRVL